MGETATSGYPPTQSLSAMSITSGASATSLSVPHRIPFGASFFIFGLLNNVLYVVILSAALDLVDKATTPKAHIWSPSSPSVAPALLVKIGWPYFVPGEAQYSRRIVSCSAISFIGIIVVATSPTLFLRLAGIAIASFSSGLGEMTYLQLTTVYGSLELPVDLGGFAVGWFSSGTGAAGLVGAGLWWILRGLGVRIGLLICSFLPLCMTLTFYCLLPSTAAFSSTPFDAYSFVIDADSEDDSEEEEETALMTPIGTRARSEPIDHDGASSLSTKEKLALARPLVVRYMLPLFFVYLAEYTINSGVSPTLVYEVPSRSDAPILSLIIKSLRDYYPLWQLVYQTFVFISRSSLSILRLPPLPINLLPLPTLFQLCLLAVTSLESASGFISSSLGENGTIVVVFFLIAAEGIFGGTAYVNCFYRLGKEEEEGEGLDEGKSKKRRLLEKEFKIASVGFADTLGILLASLVASGLEPWLVRQQVARGRTLCLEL